MQSQSQAGAQAGGMDEKDKKAGKESGHRPDGQSGKQGEGQPAGNESANPVGNPNDVGTAGDYSR
ncbi:hypothetical protein [Noviherbaspirillum galbum]|uniref:Uncharacterized protein n=1 Tax=Noviherbaspirillum galbum TaxID=2709383 RepID=A0A6B3SKU6_9BURK|nr:hypothetical protein [Noviherbaspirillum galbum]NEX59975.1 hypothetical protein [Noviherbaspirillum galbum]